jgi:GH18 family chitinase
MKKISLITLAVFITGVMQTVSAQKSKEIIGYFPSWQMYKRNGCVVPEVLDYSKYSILNYSFYCPDKEGNLQGTDAWADSILLKGKIDWSKPQPAYFPNSSLVDYAHLYGVKVMVSIGGWTLSDNFPRIAADPKKRAHFAEECVKLLKEYQFDGIDIDWEYPGYDEHSGTKEDKNTYPLFMKAIRDSIDAYGAKLNYHFLLTAAFGANTPQMENIKWNEITFMDYYNMMTYDFNGPWSDDANHNSPLYNPAKGYKGSLDEAFRLMTQTYKVPAEKLNMGVAFYGRSLRGFDGEEPITVYRTGHHKKADDVIFAEWEGSPSYYNILEEMKKHGYKEYWDDVAKVPYLVSEQEKSFVSYDNPKSIRMKADYIVEKKCAGAIIWDASCDYVEKKPGSSLISGTPLLDQLNESFYGATPPVRPRIKKRWK